MSGISILNTFEVVTAYKPTWSWTIFAIVLVLTFIFIGFISTFFINTNNFGKKFAKKPKEKRRFIIGLTRIIVTIVLSLAISIFCGFAIKDKTPKTTETRYEVLISDNMSFKEFHANYEIIEQRGEIYVIRERDNYEQRE